MESRIATVTVAEFKKLLSILSEIPPDNIVGPVSVDNDYIPELHVKFPNRVSVTRYTLDKKKIAILSDFFRGYNARFKPDLPKTWEALQLGLGLRIDRRKKYLRKKRGRK